MMMSSSAVAATMAGTIFMGIRLDTVAADPTVWAHLTVGAVFVAGAAVVEVVVRMLTVAFCTNA